MLAAVCRSICQWHSVLPGARTPTPTPRGHRAAKPQHSPLGPCRTAGFPGHTQRIFPSPVADAALSVGDQTSPLGGPRIPPPLLAPLGCADEGPPRLGLGAQMRWSGPPANGPGQVEDGPHAHLRIQTQRPGGHALPTQLSGRPDSTALMFHRVQYQRSEQRGGCTTTSVITGFQDVSSWDKRTCLFKNVCVRTSCHYLLFLHSTLHPKFPQFCGHTKSPQGPRWGLEKALRTWPPSACLPTFA